MKKKKIRKYDGENEANDNIPEIASELNSAELETIRSNYDKSGEDRSKLPPPENKKQSKLVKIAKKNTAATVIISAFAVALISAIVLLVIYAVNNSGISESHSDFVFTYGDKEEIKMKYEDVVIDDVLYIDMNKLAEYAEFSISGSAESMKYIAMGDTYIKFTHERSYCIINSTKVSIPAPAIVKDGKCLVPYTVISNAVSSGLEFKSNRVKNTVSIKRTTYEIDEIIYNNDITFSSEKFEVIQSIKNTSSLTYTYTNDVSDLMQYIDPEDNTPYLLLVNPDNPLSDTYVPVGLSPIPARYTAGVTDTNIYELQHCAMQALVAMMKDMYSEYPSNGAYVTSAYRSYEYQANKFEQYIKQEEKKGYSREEAEEIVLKTSARAGTSEHQSGLCVDFLTTSMKNGLNNAEFEQTRAFEWLSENAYKYGFVLRYPESKEEEISHDYESWHYRFVGRKAAAEIYFSNLCLEEYLELIH